MNYPGQQAPRNGDESPWQIATAVAVCVFVFVVIVSIPFVLWPAYSRYQRRADAAQSRSQKLKNARNEVVVNEIQISQQAQVVKITKQRAQIRYQNAIGIRRAQDEIAKTLTPLYVQEDEIDALKAIALSGRNATVIYVPIGSDGRPIVEQTSGGLPITTTKP